MQHKRIQVFTEDFQDFTPGDFSKGVGPLTEYHFLPEAAPSHNWAVACFGTHDGGTAWKIEQHAGRRVMCQVFENPEKHTHPILASGDFLWRDYEVTLAFRPMQKGRSGLVFRYRNNRCYYFFGFDASGVILLKVNHEKAFHVPDETVLASTQLSWECDREYVARVNVEGSALSAELEGVATLQAEDEDNPNGKIGLLADVPARFSSLSVAMSVGSHGSFRADVARREQELETLAEAFPRPKLWKKLATPGFGTGRNIRFGDLNGDGRLEIVVAQVVAHGPKDAYSETGCVTALDLDGKVLWQSGRADPDNYKLTNDVAFQVHDLDGDGCAEVVIRS